MRGHTDSISLTRRLIDRYLMFGLGGLFLCLAVSLVLAWRGTLTTLAPMAALPALAVLVAGILALWRTTRLNSEIEGQLRRIAGVSSAAEFSLQPLGATEPAAIGWNHLIEKLADRRALAELEERLAASVGGLKQESLRQALHSLSDGIALADAEGTISLANNAFAALLAGPNARADAVEGTGIQTLLGPMHTRDVETLSTRLRDSLGEVVAEVRRSTDPADGVLRLSRAPLLGDGEQRRRFVWTVRDVTQQKLAENMRNEFVFTATHELRTPLANIKAYAETLALQDDIDVERQKEFCNVINSEATRLARFVDELLNISRMEAGSLSLARHETDVERLLKEVVEHVMPQMDQKQIAFEIVLPPKLPKLDVDKDKIVAAMVNLLGNAAKYTPAGGRVVLHVETAADDLRVHVEDSGIGIAEHELPRIFEKFFRSGDARVREISGSGLGLAFTHEVIRMHGGALTVHSELNKGSKFTMSLPLK